MIFKTTVIKVRPIQKDLSYKSKQLWTVTKRNF